MPQKVLGRPYDSQDLRELMDNAGGWAQSWDDVLWYLKHVAAHDNEFSLADVPALADDVRELGRRHAPFTTDYRQLYKELTGQPCQDRAEPAARQANLHLRLLADKWLQGLRFPAGNEDVLERAKANHAPAPILQVLKPLKDPRYATMGRLLQAVQDQARQMIRGG